MILKRINACRLHLQVTLLSKIVSANGKAIKMNTLKEKINSIDSKNIWPRKKFPDTATWKLWSSLLKRIFYSYDNQLIKNHELGPWEYSAS